MVRVHPHINSKSKSEEDYWLSQAEEGITVIEPLSKVDSYALLEASKVVVAYISSVGIEASYRKKPVIALGRSMWYYSDEVMKPVTKKELEDYLLDPMIPKSNIGAEYYGCYEHNKGILHSYYQPITDSSGSIYDIDIFGNMELHEHINLI